jgi:predicted metal-dependent hydrolase
MIMRYKVVKSARRTVSLEVAAGKVTVRAPYSMRRKDIKAYVNENEDWIRQKRKEYPRRLKGRRLTADDLEMLTVRAHGIFTQLVRECSAQLGVKYNHIHIHHKKNKWGHCSAHRTLNFNCLLLMMPREVLHSVVWQVLCRLKYRCNKRKFKKELYRVCPNYDIYAEWLKKNKKDYTRRLPRKSAESQDAVVLESVEQPLFIETQAPKLKGKEKAKARKEAKAAAKMEKEIRRAEAKIFKF